jgi:predicted AAA+ superfamily ATPase
MIIQRNAMTDLVRLIGNFPAVGVVGPRQVGKTFLVKQLRDRLDRESVYLDLELSSDLSKLQDPQFFLQQFADKTVILDEVQRLPQLFPLLRALIDQNRVPARFILLGSASPALIRDVSESLAGRIAYLEIGPLSFKEVSTEVSQQTVWLRGGFPLSLLSSSDSTAQEWMRFFVRSYIERDLPLLGLQVSPVQIERLWKMLAWINGQILSISDIANSLGVSATTAKRYIDFMENAYLIRRIFPVWTNLKKRMVKAPKIYIRDTGVLHSLLNISGFDDLMANPAVGHSWEGFVIQEIVANMPKNMEMHFYRTQNGAEVDLVLTRGMETVAAIEIKLSDSPSLSRGNTLAFNDLMAKANFIITPGSDDYLMREKIRVCPLSSFVNNYLPGL